LTCCTPRKSENLCLLLLRLLREDLGVGVQAQKNLLVAQGVLLLDGGSSSHSLALGSVDGALDFGAVDQTSKVGLGDNVGRQEEVPLVGRGSGGGAVDLVKGLESGRGPDDETAEVTTRGELEKVEGRDGRGLNTGDVAEALDELLAIDLRVVDNQRATALAVAAATELALTGTELLGALDLLEIGTGANGLEEGEGGSSAGDGATLNESRVDNQGNLRDGHDLVATSKQERGGGGGSQGGAGSISLLALVDLDVPLAPDLGRGEHATRSAHVTKGGLTSTVGTGTRDTRDTGNSTTSSPRLGRGLVTSLLANSIRLALVLGHASVNLLHDIRSDRAGEDSGDGVGSSRGSTIFADDRDGRSGSHCEGRTMT